MKFLRKKTKAPTTRTNYPDGSFIETEKGYFYIAGPDKRYRVTSERILNSWSPRRIAASTEAAVKHYRIAAKLGFRHNSLIHNLADGKIYLIVHGKRHQMVSPEAFERLGTHPNAKEIVTVSQYEIDLHREGEAIS